jgi:hypothetical protein
MMQEEINPADKPNHRSESIPPELPSDREAQILGFLGKFLTKKEIADHLGTPRPSSGKPPASGWTGTRSRRKTPL